MLKNILFFLLLVFGIQISIVNIPFGIIYNFCLIFIFNKYLFLNNFENFTNCIYNSPSYQVSLNPLIIDLGAFSKCNANNPYLQKITINSITNEILFNLEIKELKTKFAKGDIINISGTSLPSNRSYTIQFITNTKIQIKEQLLINQTITNGKVIIKYASSLIPSDSFIIYKYDNLNDNITNVDNSVVMNETNLKQIKIYQDLIKKANNDIDNNNKKMKLYELQINSNINTNEINKNTIKDKYLLTDKYSELIKSNADLSNNKLNEINTEIYNSLDTKLLNINNNLSANEENKLNILTLNKKNKELNLLKCSYISKIKNLMKEINKNYKTIITNNNNIDIQNTNYNLFMDKCNKIYNMDTSIESEIYEECKYNMPNSMKNQGSSQEPSQGSNQEPSQESNQGLNQETN